jgi:hypothetical protein
MGSELPIGDGGRKRLRAIESEFHRVVRMTQQTTGTGTSGGSARRAGGEKTMRIDGRGLRCIGFHICPLLLMVNS